MIFADKLIELRKRHGMSQEELADRLNVTRQSISKWEGAQSVPDLQKVVQLSQLFGVSTDVLLRDELTLGQAESVERNDVCKKVSLADAEAYIKHSKASATRSSIATGLFTFILEVVLLMSSQQVKETIGATLVTVLGTVIIIACIVIGTAISISNSSRSRQFLYVEEEVFKLEGEAIEIVEKRMARFRIQFVINNIIGSILCFAGLLPFLPLNIFTSENESIVYLLIIGIVLGACIFVYNGVRWSAFRKLLAQGRSVTSGKRIGIAIERAAVIYWLITLTIYLVWSLSTLNWTITWLVWAVAAVLFSVVLGIVDSATDKFDSGEE